MTTRTARPILVLILLVASFFRFFHLTSSPPALNWDEVSIGYNAYSILKTGRDEWGERMPLSFRAFGEHKLPGMIYASVPGIALLGLNDLGVRVTPAVIGVLSVLSLYLLVARLFSPGHGLMAAFLMAVSPWAVHFSRASFEAGLALLLTILALIALSRANTNSRYYYLAGALAVLAAYTYNSIRILLPLLLLVYSLNGVINWARSRRTLTVVALLGLLLVVPILRELRSPEGRVRWGATSILSQKSFIDGIAESRGYTTLPGPWPRLIHNKATHYLYAVADNYLRTFSTEFLFFEGSGNTQRSVQGLGLLYLFELPLIIFGLIELLGSSKKYDKARRLLLPLLLLAPIPSAITIDAPSSVRALSLLPALLAIESLGLASAISYLKTKSKLISLVVVAFVSWSIAYFCYLLFFVYPVKYSVDWAYGYRQSIGFVMDHYDEAANIYITSKYGEPYIYTLFYGQIDPEKYQNMRRDYSIDPLGWVHVEGFGKFHFSDFYGLESPQEIVARNKGLNLLLTPFAVLPSNFPRDFALQAPTWAVMFEGSLVEGNQ